MLTSLVGSCVIQDSGRKQVNSQRGNERGESNKDSVHAVWGEGDLEPGHTPGPQEAGAAAQPAVVRKGIVFSDLGRDL